MFFRIDHALTNPGAESGDMTGWLVESGTIAASTGYAHTGTYSFDGGSGGVDSVMSQEVDLLAEGVSAANIDNGDAWCFFNYWKNPFGESGDVVAIVHFLDAAHAGLGELKLPSLVSYFTCHVQSLKDLPPLTRYYKIEIQFYPQVALDNNEQLYVDDIAVSTGSFAVESGRDVLRFIKAPVAGPLLPLTVEPAQVVRGPGYHGAAFINGTVTVEGEPAERRVLLYARANMQLLDAAWSAPDGAYRFENLNASLRYLVVATDYTGEFNAVVADNVTPEVAA